MELASLTFASTRENGDHVKTSFTIHEETHTLKLEDPTDTGTISSTLARGEEIWTCQKMTIDFASQKGIYLTGLARKGFDLGR